MYSYNFSLPAATRLVGAGLLMCVLILGPSGCISSAAPTLAEPLGRTGVILPPVPRTPGAVVTDEYVCIPHDEAAELMLWIEHAEDVCR